MVYKITTKKSDYVDFPVAVYVNGDHVDDFQSKPTRREIIAIYEDQKAEGIL